MIRTALAAATTLLLGACMTLPGSGTPPTSRYLLRDVPGDCSAGDSALNLSVVRASAGLNSERIARRDAASGEITYLSGVRWADQLPLLLEQQLARDLECRGFAVITGHQRALGQPRLVCEVRAFNLLEDGSDQAEAWLSCMFYRDNGEQQSLSSRHRIALGRWNADSAVAALSDAYNAVFTDLAAGMETGDAGAD